MGVDWGRDDGEYEYDDLDRPHDRRKRKQGADWDDRDWAPRDEPMGPGADRDRDFQPERTREDEERYRQEYSDRARAHHYRGAPMSEEEREKRQFEEARWEASREPRRAPPPQKRGYRGSGGNWEEDVYRSHRPPDQNTAADEFYRMQEQEWRDKQYEDPYHPPKKKVKGHAPKWYRTEGEKSRMAKRQAHTPYVEKEKIILETYSLPKGVYVVGIVNIILAIIGIMIVIYNISRIQTLLDQVAKAGLEVPQDLVDTVYTLLYIEILLLVVIIIGGILLFKRKRSGYLITISAPLIIFIFYIVRDAVLIMGWSGTGLVTMFCAIPPIFYFMVVYLYLKQYSTLFK